MKIPEIKYPQKFKFYIDSTVTISKTFRFAKLSTCKNDSNLQFAKLSPSKIKVFYSRFTGTATKALSFRNACCATNSTSRDI